MSLIKEFWDFMKVRKKFWLAPILIVLVILSGFIVLASLSPAAAPFIYTLFKRVGDGALTSNPDVTIEAGFLIVFWVFKDRFMRRSRPVHVSVCRDRLCYH